MSTFPHCCDTSTLYVGLDSACNKSAVICTLHGTHPNPTGIMHNIMPITHFKSVVNELKFQMSDKVSALVQKYNNFMDDLIAEVTELKIRKSIEMSTLWVRQLAQTEEEYQQFKKIFRNDLQGFTCMQIANFYDKMLRGVNIKEKKLDNIDCYKEINKVMEKLQNTAKARMLIVQKVADLEGIVQSGQLLKRALPDRKVLKENTREILLQTQSTAQIDIRYNKATLKKGGVNYRSVFSKYSLIPNTNYHLNINTKYANILIGVCSQAVKQSKQSADLHYNINSLAFNCSNGCLYRDAMFESGNAHLTKSKKNLELILRINDTEMMILMDKNVVCRTKLKQFAKNALYLHILMRTEGDSFQIDSDKMNSFEPIVEQQEAENQNDSIVEIIEVRPMSLDQGSMPSSLTIDKYVPLKTSEKLQVSKKSRQEEELSSNKNNEPLLTINKYNTFGQYTNDLVIQLLKKPNSDHFRKQVRFDETQRKSSQSNKNYLDPPRKNSNAQSLVHIQTSLFASNNDHQQFLLRRKNTRNQEKRSQKQLLINPVVMTPIRKSQFEQFLKEESNIENVPSLSLIPKRQSSGIQYVPQGLRITELQSSQSM